MSDFSKFSDRTLKVSLDGETRRGKLSIPAGANAMEVFSGIQAAVSALFDVPVAQMWLGYADEEGDVCTLSEHSVSDLGFLAPEGVLRLTLKARSLAPSEDEVMEPAPCSEAMEESPSVDGHEHTCSTDMLKARLQQLIRRVPPQMRAIALAWVQNLDPASLHGFLGTALASSEQRGGGGMSCGEANDESRATLESMRSLHGMEPSALKALLVDVLIGELHTGSAESADASTPSVPHVDNPLEGLLGSLLGGKGVGKGPYSNACSTGADVAANPLAQVLGSIGPLLASKGLGKGAGGSSPQAPDMLHSLLGNIFAGKGIGKGSQSEAAPGRQVPSPTPSAAGGTDLDDGSAARTAFEESVTDLINMGLVTDRQTARELLTKHGDISSVVSALTEDSDGDLYS